MRIGIDARLYGPEHTGIGRYVQNLIQNLARVDKKNTYIIFGGQKAKEEISSFSNFKFRKLNTKVYGFSEQITNPFIFSQAKLDLLHVPHFNAPLFYFGPLVITIHDLIKHFSVGKGSTTLPLYQYYFKQIIYRLSTFYNLRRAGAIITPSNFWKEYLVTNFHLPEKKIFVTYEAVDKKIKPVSATSEILKKYHLTKPFLVYTGNLYPHKNVNLLFEAVKKFNLNHEHQLQLAIICSRSIFHSSVTESKAVKLLGFVPDEDLAKIYSQALALVQPSLLEGFGLTGLEAMAANLPVLSSNATCLPEVYGDAAVYFDPKNVNDLIKKIDLIMTDKKLVLQLIERGKNRIKQFSWYKTAKETIAVYQQSKKGF